MLVDSTYMQDRHFEILDFCLTLHHQLGKVIYINPLDATVVY